MEQNVVQKANGLLACVQSSHPVQLGGGLVAKQQGRQGCNRKLYGVVRGLLRGGTFPVVKTNGKGFVVPGEEGILHLKSNADIVCGNVTAVFPEELQLSL